VHEEVRAWFEAVEGPGLGRVVAGWDPRVTPDGRTLAFTAFRRAALDEGGRTTIGLVDTATGEVRTVGEGCHDRLPRWSPDGRRLAYLTDRGGGHRPAVVWTAPDLPEAVVPGPSLSGTPETVEWSPDGTRLLVVVREDEHAPGPSWWPRVDRPSAPVGWRHLQVVEVATGQPRRVSAEGWTVWEAVWAGPAAIAAVVSAGPGEGAWYDARLVSIPLDGSEHRTVLTSDVQIGRPSASPSGRRLAVVESFCSDRSLVAGDLVLVEGADRRRLDTLGTDVASSSWRGEDVLFFVGVRGQQSVAGEVDLASGVTRELWVSDGATSGVYPQAVQDAEGAVYAVAESYRRAPHVVAVQDGRERLLADLSHPGSEHLLAHAGEIRRVHWAAPDGTALDGFLVTPPETVAAPPYPVVLDIHGGPVWTWHDQWKMRGETGPLLASRGYAVLYVNQRGGTGRGQGFARSIAGDMLGDDTGDFLAAVDHLVEEGVVDPARVGVTGTSYGGCMALWLVARHSRFAAAVPVSGVSDWVSFHHTTTIPEFDLLFLPGDPLEPGGEYVRRSPLAHAADVRTPVLLVAGLQDRDVPPSQSQEMHSALAARGGVSELVVYPEEGHVVGDFPAVVDVVARTVAWFERHLE
jgi:dipeptidyl aminopeptidase/acylaminoacyl peptidase